MELNPYSAYGLNIASDIALPELPQRVGDQDGAPSSGANRVVMCRDERARRSHHAHQIENAGEVRLSHEGIGDFLICDGREILYAMDDAGDEDGLRLFLLGTALAVLLHQRGNLVLHASAVAVDGGAVAFLGASGQGKSTTAAAMHSLGHDLVADDLVPVELNLATAMNETMCIAAPTVFPGFPQIKLWPEAAAALNASHLHELHPETTKRASRIEEGFHDRALPLRRIFVLDSDVEEVEETEGAPQHAPGAAHEYSCAGEATAKEASRIQLLGLREACMELVRHTYCFPLIDDARRENGASHLAQCAELAQRVPVCRLRSRFAEKGLSALPALAKLVLDDLKGDGFTTRPYRDCAE